LEATEFKPVDLLKVAQNVSALLGYQLEQENIKISINAGGNGYWINGNQNEMEQVLTNLILNARDAIKKIKKSGRIEIGFIESGDAVKMQVKDEGCGIPPEIKAKIFDPFFTTKDVGKGTGLGLSICQSIAEKHRGKITFRSEVNKGSEFTVELPKETRVSKG
jgi:signal transduction histidine kinase